MGLKSEAGVRLESEVSAEFILGRETALEPAVRLTRAEAPNSGYTGEWQNAVIAGHVEALYVDNPGVALGYIDGPSPTITVIDPLTGREQVVGKGFVWAVYKTGSRSLCTDIGAYNFVFKVPEKGVYTLWLLAGYVVETRFLYTDYREVLFTAEERPKPAPPWWEQQFLGMPLWLWLVIGSGVLSATALAASVAFAIASRGRRESPSSPPSGRTSSG